MAQGHSLQNQFLSALLSGNVPIIIYLVNGIRLQGSLHSYDQFGLLVKNGAAQQFVYKHAISTIVPGEDMRLTIRQFGEEGQNA